MTMQENFFFKPFGLGYSGDVAVGAGLSPARPMRRPAAAFPQKGKVITFIQPNGAGGGSDVGAAC